MIQTHWRLISSQIIAIHNPGNGKNVTVRMLFQIDRAVLTGVELAGICSYI
jgi:hypothetical protein